jgi:creatinine amidohydrolase/Fe(II)-dependent formamide hydrolase-like protein
MLLESLKWPEVSRAVLVTPALQLGHSEHRMNFAGTVSVEREFIWILWKSRVHSMVRHGAKKIFFPVATTVIRPATNGN